MAHQLVYRAFNNITYPKEKPTCLPNPSGQKLRRLRTTLSSFRFHPSSQEFVILESLPAILHRIEGRIEDDAVCVQVRVKGT